MISFISYFVNDFPSMLFKLYFFTGEFQVTRKYDNTCPCNITFVLANQSDTFFIINTLGIDRRVGHKIWKQMFHLVKR